MAVEACVCASSSARPPQLAASFFSSIRRRSESLAQDRFFDSLLRWRPLLRKSPAMAAGVTDRLWEISDIVAMLEAWEAKEKRDAKPVFEVMEWKIGGGFYVKATLPNTEPENITGFATKNDAIRWVRNESAAWLHARRRAVIQTASY
jgi:hypothetical protein